MSKPICPSCKHDFTGNWGISPQRLCYVCGILFVSEDDLMRILSPHGKAQRERALHLREMTKPLKEKT